MKTASKWGRFDDSTCRDITDFDPHPCRNSHPGHLIGTVGVLPSLLEPFLLLFKGFRQMPS